MKTNKSALRMQVKYPHCAGIDIAKCEHFVAVPANAGGEQEVRSFGGFTEELERMVRWLKTCGIEQVAMEATGVYWIPAYELLESAGFEVWLVNPRGVKRPDGRKSDVLDCQWLQQLMSFGLLTRSHRPTDAYCELRSYVRGRARLTQDRGRCVQRMQKALYQMNVHLDSVLSDIAGKSGLAIIDAIVAGERCGEALAELCDFRVKASAQEVAASLRGNWRAEHLFELQQALNTYRHLCVQLEEIEERLCAKAEKLSEGAMKVNRQTGEVMELSAKNLKSPERTGWRKNLQLTLWQLYGVDLTAVPGIGVETALTVLSEVGPDLSAFPDAAHFASWLGLAPGTRISGGKKLSGSAPRRKQTAGQALRMSALTLRGSKSYLGEAHRARCRRLDPPRAIKATAHQLARLIYSMMWYGEEYSEKGAEQFQQERRTRRIRQLRRQAKQFGFQIQPVAEAA